MVTEAEVKKVMDDTGMDRMQAVRHVESAQRMTTTKARFPLGSNAALDHDAEYAAWAQRHPQLAAQHRS